MTGKNMEAKTFHLVREWLKAALDLIRFFAAVGLMLGFSINCVCDVLEGEWFNAFMHAMVVWIVYPFREK